MPSAWWWVVGSWAPWTDHEKNVCSFERAAISSLVIVPGAVEMPMGHLAAGSTTWRRPGVSTALESPSLGRHYSTSVGPRALPRSGRGASHPAAAHRSQVVGDEKHSQREQADEEDLAEELEREDRSTDDGEGDR